MDPKILHRFFALRPVVPFRLAADETVMVVAQIAQEKTYDPGQRVARAGEALNHLLVIAAGDFADERLPLLPACWDLSGLVQRRLLERDLLAGPNGLTLWRIPRAQFLVLLLEAPELLLDALDDSHGAPTASSPTP